MCYKRDDGQYCWNKSQIENVAHMVMPNLEKEDSIKVLGSSARSIALDKPGARAESPPSLIKNRVVKPTMGSPPAQPKAQTKPKLQMPLQDLQRIISPVQKKIEATIFKMQLEAAATQGREAPRTAVAKPLRR